MNKLSFLKQYKTGYVRALYGRHGRSSGLKPGVLWPRKEELPYLKQYEKTFFPKLDDLIRENKSKKEDAIRKRQEREREILENLEKLPAAFESFFDKIETKKREREEYIKKKEAMIEEVREILGFRAKPSDERFQEALAKREEEEVAARRKEARKRKENAGLEEMLGLKPKKE